MRCDVGLRGMAMSEPGQHNGIDISAGDVGVEVVCEEGSDFCCVYFVGFQISDSLEW